MVLTWARCCGLFLWQLPDRPDSLRILQPNGSDIVRPKTDFMMYPLIQLVQDALCFVSPDLKGPVTPGSRYEGYIKQFVNPVADNASQTEEEEVAGDSESNKKSANPGKTVRKQMLEEIYAKQAAQDEARKAAAQTAAQTAGQTAGQEKAPSSVPASFGPPSKSAPAPPPSNIETKPATLPHRNPPKQKGVTPAPSPMPVIQETGPDAQEEPASREPQQDQPVPDNAGWSSGWQQQSNSWRNWSNWGWAKPRGVPWWYSICCVYI